MLVTLVATTAAGVLLWWLAHAKHSTRVWVGNAKQADIAMSRRGTRKGWALIKRGLGVLYPVTKRKLHRLLHVLGLLVAGGAGTALWVAGLPLTIPEKIVGTLTLVSTLLTSVSVGIKGADRFVDQLPIPADDVITTVTTSTTTVEHGGTVVDEADQLAVTGVHGKGDLA
jgi:hypothetical protein